MHLENGKKVELLGNFKVVEKSKDRVVIYKTTKNGEIQLTHFDSWKRALKVAKLIRDYYVIGYNEGYSEGLGW